MTAFDGIQLVNIVRNYGHVQALRGAHFEAQNGEVTALIGDNGAGKSTLVKILSGAERQDSGEIRVNGELFHPSSPADATARGIETVYQDLALAGHLDPPSNVFLGRELRRWRFFLDKRQMLRQTQEQFAELGVATLQDLAAPVSALSGGQRQAVAIARAAIWARTAIVLDEPTAALGVIQTEKVMDLIRRIRDRGIAVILISHNLPQVIEIADRVEVLRLGKRVARFDKSSMTLDRLVSANAGAYSNELEHEEEIVT